MHPDDPTTTHAAAPQSRIETASESEAEAICAGLRGFNSEIIGAYEFRSLWLAARDADGRVIGGVVGYVGLGWLHLEVLWVEQAARGRGLGAALLLQAERRAREWGARQVHLDTFDWQAEGFYLKHGYREFGRLHDFPPGRQRLFLQKSLSSE
ncbi:GNAT family N-acetyltransferase [Lysobacter capsici]|uniref:GNAT family N-acetyltransferase n=1 Tax=Lysobacter capsici TaxID=435897 RepID=UPI001BFFEF12|nr:GNAT family N-acetyltransferase [Lysobacter capsici]QWF16736.1 GNAT family N-acetyltransferase [Lysobacter capsici]